MCALRYPNLLHYLVAQVSTVCVIGHVDSSSLVCIFFLVCILALLYYVVTLQSLVAYSPSPGKRRIGGKFPSLKNSGITPLTSPYFRESYSSFSIIPQFQGVPHELQCSHNSSILNTLLHMKCIPRSIVSKIGICGIIFVP